LQRFYERREDRFLDLIWPQVGEIHDLDRLENGRRGVFYTKQKPLNLQAVRQRCCAFDGASITAETKTMAYRRFQPAGYRVNIFCIPIGRNALAQ
jgi:hypothetical protein